MTTKKNCPHLSGNYMLSCKADREVYVPSISELEEYCKSARHPLCPYFIMVNFGKNDRVRRSSPLHG